MIDILPYGITVCYIQILFDWKRSKCHVFLLWNSTI